MKIKFDNIGMSLHVLSMRKLHHVVHTCVEESAHDKLFKKGFITVAHMPGKLISVIQLLAKQYGAGYKGNLVDRNSESKPYTGLFIKVDGKFFQVAYVACAVTEANDIMNSRDDISLICTSLASDEVPELYFIACNIPSPTFVLI